MAKKNKEKQKIFKAQKGAIRDKMKEDGMLHLPPHKVHHSKDEWSRRPKHNKGFYPDDDE